MGRSYPKVGFQKHLWKESNTDDDHLPLCAAYFDPASTGGALWPESLCITTFWLTSSYKDQALQRLRCCFAKKPQLEGTQIQISAAQGTSKGLATERTYGSAIAATNTLYPTCINYTGI